MLLTLIKKQYREFLRSVFVSRKTGKLHSKASVAGMFALYAFILAALCGSFFSIAMLMGEALIGMGLEWLHFALMGLLAILLGTFGSVFSTYSVLYLAKDNELLLSMPIRPAFIVITRMSLVYGVSLLYSGIVWIPAVIVYWIYGTPTAAAVCFDLLLVLVLPLLISVVTCVLGWVVAVVSARIRNKNLLVLLFVVVFLGGYYYAVAHMTSFIQYFLKNAAQIGSGIQTWTNFLYQMAMAAVGDGKQMLAFSGITLVLAGVCLWVIARSFISIATRRGENVKRDARLRIHTSGMRTALLRRELARFMASSVYMLNAGLGVVLLLVLGILAVIQKGTVAGYLKMLMLTVPGLNQLLPLLVPVGVGVLLSTNQISTPSISLEGKHLWILRSLPAAGREVLAAKLELHVLLNLIPVLVGVIGLSICLDVPASVAVLCVLVCEAQNWFLGAFGLMIGLLNPNFQWTSETYVVKQSVNTLIGMLAGVVIVVLMAAGGWFLRGVLSVPAYLGLTAAVLLCADTGMTAWLMGKGGQIFDSL